MQQQGFAADFNVGQVVQGSVYTNNLVLNIGGEPCPLWQVESGKVAELRDTLGTILSIRRGDIRRAGRQVFCFGVGLAMLAAGFLGCAHVVYFVAGNYVPLLLWSVLLSLASVGAMIAAHRGPRRPRRAIAYLEDIQARLDAELDMRSWGFGQNLRCGAAIGGLCAAGS